MKKAEMAIAIAAFDATLAKPEETLPHESGQRKSGMAALQKLTKALGLDMDDLVDESAL